MYKVIIVDDDNIILKGLTQNIAWSQHGLELVGSARDGEEAIGLIALKTPHIIVTDIRMPFMDGFGLTEAVKQRFPDIKIIMLTSFDEFELAKKALQLKVFDYLLKPIDNSVLLETVSRAVKELEYEAEMKRKVVEGMPLLRQRFLENLIKGTLTEEEINSSCDFLNINLSAGKYVVLLLKADDYSYPDYQNRFGQEMLKFCILNAAEEIIRDEYNGIVFDSQEDEIVIVYYDNGANESVEHKMMLMAEVIRQKIEQFLKTTVTVGVGCIYDDLRNIALSYQDAKSAIEYRHMIGTNRVLTVGDTGLSSSKTVDIKLNGLEKDLVMNVRLGLEKEVDTVLDEIENNLIKIKYIPLSKLRLLAVEITLLLFKEFEGITNDAETNKAVEEIMDSYTFYCQLQTFQTKQEVFESIRQLTKQFSELANRQRERQMKSNIHNAIDYINKNYMAEGLSLLDVASHVHISPTYLSILFKKEKSITFSDYLLQLRINAAIELLRTTDLKTYEVAEKVGYSNPQYFSQCFKKYTGQSPTDYKQQTV